MLIDIDCYHKFPLIIRFRFSSTRVLPSKCKFSGRKQRHWLRNGVMNGDQEWEWGITWSSGLAGGSIECPVNFETFVSRFPSLESSEFLARAGCFALCGTYNTGIDCGLSEFYA